MFQEEKTFIFRFSLKAEFPEAYEGDQDGYQWLKEWETAMKPELLKAIFTLLRRHPDWKAHVQNRGVSPDDEIEIALTKEISEK